MFDGGRAGEGGVDVAVEGGDILEGEVRKAWEGENDGNLVHGEQRADREVCHGAEAGRVRDSEIVE